MTIRSSNWLCDPLSGKDLAKLVEAKGWTLLRVNGSHHIYSKPGVNVRLSIPIHGSVKLKSGLQRHLMKLAGLPTKPASPQPPPRSPKPAAALGSVPHDHQAVRLRQQIVPHPETSGLLQPNPLTNPS